MLAAAALAVGFVVTQAPTAGGVGTVPSPTVDNSVHLNQMQVVGSHNSFKTMLSAAEQNLRQTFIGVDNANKMAYQHQPLGVQFQSQKVRQIELDLFVDTAGGKYASPLIRNVAGQGAYNEPAMAQPGIKVMHVQDVDYGSTCVTLVLCLQQVKAWSDANPNHLPLSILLELKDDTPVPIITQAPTPWDVASLAAMDAEIRSVFPPSDLITPDDVRGSHATLSEAVTTDGWPTLGESRGKVMFAMDNDGAYRTKYLTGSAVLAGRPVFTNSTPGQPDAAFIKRNDPNDSSIPGLVGAGYIVRTRADSDTLEARANNTGPRDKALASGAQWVSSDYPAPGMGYGFTSPYVVEIPGGTVARCNPVNGPPACRSTWLDPKDWPDTPVTTTSVPPTTSTTSTTAPTTTSSTTTTTKPPTTTTSTTSSTSTTTTTTSTTAPTTTTTKPPTTTTSTTSTTTTTKPPTTTTSSTSTTSTTAPTTTSTSSSTTSTSTTSTTVPPCTADVAPFASANQLVGQLFEDILGRTPTAAEWDEWLAPIVTCATTGDDLAAELVPTDQATTDARLARLYLAFFKRPPDPDGFAYWKRQLEQGRGLINAARKFAGSTEFQRTYGSLTNGAFVDLVYENVLGRPGDAAGRTFWVTRLDNGTKNRGDVMINFSESTENQRQQRDAVSVFRLFRGMRARFPSKAELVALLDPIANHGEPLSSAARTIRTSPGYAARF